MLFYVQLIMVTYVSAVFDLWGTAARSYLPCTAASWRLPSLLNGQSTRGMYGGSCHTAIRSSCILFLLCRQSTFQNPTTNIVCSRKYSILRIAEFSHPQRLVFSYMGVIRCWLLFRSVCPGTKTVLALVVACRAQS